MDILNKFVDIGFNIRNKIKKKEKWYADIVDTFEERKNILNNEEFCLENEYHIINCNDIEWLIYVSSFKNKYVEIRIYNPTSQSIFETKFNCYVDKYMFVLDELMTPSIDGVLKIPVEIFLKVFDYVEEYCKTQKLVAIKISHSNFRLPLNEFIKKISLTKAYSEKQSKSEKYMYKVIK